MSDPINIGSVDDIPEGEARVLDGGDNSTGVDISIFHAEDGSFYALDDECTHEEASLADGFIEDSQVECPLHAAAFCLKTGKALCLPATENARTHRVEVRDGELYLYPGEPAATQA